jgi:hypothetical protein
MRLVNNVHPFVVVDETYSDEELELIWQELDEYTLNNRFKRPDENNSTGSAKFDGEYLKNNSGLFLDPYWGDENRKKSHILRISQGSLFNLDFAIDVSNTNIHMRAYYQSNFHTTLVSYYDQEDYYKMHNDQCQYSVCTWLYREPKAWDGGDFIFSDSKEVVEVKNNRSIIFPSYYYHEVTPIIKKEGHTYDNGYGRYTISHFAFQLPSSAP